VYEGMEVWRHAFITSLQNESLQLSSRLGSCTLWK